MDEQYNAKMVEALQVERAGYVERGLKDRVEQVDKQLAAYGGEPQKAKRETAAEKKARLAAEAEATAAAEAAEQAAFDALSDDDKAALAALSADELAALQAK